MHVPENTRQLSLFRSELPDWESIPREAQQAVLEVVSQMLSQTLPPRDHKPNITRENDDVS